MWYRFFNHSPWIAEAHCHVERGVCREPVQVVRERVVVVHRRAAVRDPMSVYVDRARNGYGRMIMCHMIADTLDELHAMADAIGIASRWFQAAPPASFPHYDIAQSKRALAVARGAIECDRSTIVAHMRRLRPAFGVYGPGNPAPVQS